MNTGLGKDTNEEGSPGTKVFWTSWLNIVLFCLGHWLALRPWDQECPSGLVLRPMFFLVSLVAVLLCEWHIAVSAYISRRWEGVWKVMWHFMWLQVCLWLYLLPVSPPWKWACSAHPRPPAVTVASGQPAGKSLASHHPGNAGRQ
jgi:hypothetical protein